MFKSKTAIRNKTADDALAVSHAGKNIPLQEAKEKGKITGMHIKVLDDGSYHLRSETEKGHSQETSHPNHKDLMEHLNDNLTSPHLPKLGSLTDQLVSKPTMFKKKPIKARFDALA